MNDNFRPKHEPKQEEQLDLIHTSAAEFEQALTTLSNLKDGEHHDFIARWPANLQSLCELMRSTLEKRNVKDAIIVSEIMTTALSVYMGGRHLYIPNGDRLKKALRDIRIWRDFKGNNIEALSRQHHLTERHITQIVAEQKAAEIARRQRKLF